MSANWLPFSYPQFGKIWLGQLLSQMGIRVYQIAIAWWLVKNSGEHQALYLAVFFIIAGLPALIFAKPIGRWIDRSNVRTLIWRADIAAGLVTLALWPLSVFGSDLLVPIFCVGFLRALFQAIMDPCLFKAAPDLVPKNEIESAIALITTTSTVASFMGAFIGAGIMAQFEFQGMVLINSLSYFVAAGLTLATQFGGAQVLTDSDKCEVTNADSPGILAAIPHFETIQKILLTFGAINFFSMPTLIVIPIFVERVLKGDSATLALTEAGLAFGLLAGSMLSKYIKTSEVPLRAILICCLIFAGALAASSLTQALATYAFLLAIAGFALGLLNVKIISYFERIVPGDLKGQFFAYLNAIITIAMPASYVIFGFLIEPLGLKWIISIQAIGIAASAFNFLRISKSMQAKGLYGAQISASTRG